MKRNNKNQKGFFRPLILAIILIVTILSLGTIFYKQEFNIAENFQDIKEYVYQYFKIKQNSNDINKNSAGDSEETPLDYNQIISQLQEEINKLKEQKDINSEGDTEWLKQQITYLQGQLQGEQSKGEEPISNNRSPDFNINNFIPRVAQITCNNTTGSGFLISPDGLVITNYHVVNFPLYEREGKIYRSQGGQIVPGCIVSFTDDPSYPPDNFYWATIPGSFSDQEKDLAVLYIQARYVSSDNLEILNDSDKQFSFIPKCSADKFAIGDEITVLGYPGTGGSTITITNGIISGASGIYYKISAKVDHGNSGGPAIIDDGEGGCYFGIVTGGILDLEFLPYVIKADYVPF